MHTKCTYTTSHLSISYNLFESTDIRLGEAMKPKICGTKDICILIFSLTIFTAICRVFFTSYFIGDNIEERFKASGSGLMSTSATPKKLLYLVMGMNCLPVHMRGNAILATSLHATVMLLCSVTK